MKLSLCGMCCSLLWRDADRGVTPTRCALARLTTRRLAKMQTRGEEDAFNLRCWSVGGDKDVRFALR